MLRHPFTPRRDGSLDAALSFDETEAIRRVAQDVLDELEETDDPGLRRLFPPGYKDDPRANEEFRSLTRDDLVARKRGTAKAVLQSIDTGKTKRGAWSARLDEETAHAWLSLVNDARLILGTRLDVTEDMEPEPLPSSDPRAEQHNMYLYLGALESELVDALMLGLPEGGSD
jgi:hypothetical protein